MKDEDIINLPKLDRIKEMCVTFGMKNDVLPEGTPIVDSNKPDVYKEKSDLLPKKKRKFSKIPHDTNDQMSIDEMKSSISSAVDGISDNERDPMKLLEYDVKDFTGRKIATLTYSPDVVRLAEMLLSLSKSLNDVNISRNRKIMKVPTLLEIDGENISLEDDRVILFVREPSVVLTELHSDTHIVKIAKEMSEVID